MSCDVAKFTITKGLDNTFVFTIKADGEITPMQLTSSDTFQAHFINLSDGATHFSKALTLPENLESGKVTLVVTSSDTGNLTGERGAKSDRYYLKPAYKLVIDCVTTENGNFIAKVPEVYVD